MNKQERVAFYAGLCGAACAAVAMSVGWPWALLFIFLAGFMPTMVVLSWKPLT